MNFIRPAVLASTAAVVVSLVCYPLVMLAIGSFETTTPTDGVVANAFQGYKLLLQDGEMLWNSLVTSVGATIVSAIFGICLAWIVTRTNVPGRRTLEQLIMIPFYLAPMLGAVGWVLLASPSESGILNRALMSVFRLSEAPLNIYTPAGIIWVMGIYYAPFYYLFASGALRSMDPSLEESARVIGANALRTGVGITLPMIMPAIFGATMVVFVLAMGQFGVPAVLGMPRGYLVLTTRIYEHVAGFNPNYGAAAAMGLSLTTLSAIGVYLQFKILGNKSYATISGRGFQPRISEVGWWRFPLLGFAVVYILCSVLLPVGSVIWASSLSWITTDLASAQFTWGNYEYVLFDYPTTRTAVRNSVFLGFSGSIIVIVLSFILAWIFARTKFRWQRVLEFIAMAPLAVPSMVFALGILWAWIRFPLLDIYGTRWILLICFITIFLPYGLRGMSATLVQIDRSLEECASVCGASWLRTIRSITFPLMAPGAFATWTLIFVSILKELSASALLFNSKTVVLSVAIFDLLVGSSFSRVAALALIQAVMIFAILAAVRWLGGRRVAAL